MRINLLCIGRTQDKEIESLLEYYTKRLPRHWNFSLIEIPDVRGGGSLSPQELKVQEGKLFMQHLLPSDYVVLLDEKGKLYTSREFSARIEHIQNSSVKRLCFVVGGAYGFSEELYGRAQEQVSLSKMTFTHQMVRLFMVEQIYRASQILQGKPYHND
ncbi:23S rRNA (pseudouridine(1915)-N(3))-methyltransferase RlmH [Planobacterium oryzisoli]|uniref:Ribosomal RNA large subunit methyltransferase H n=1 Tax=Planobacterium oryzisoli TaxID=2771435 RepID=A0A931E624_9FLAO|nr:23S rRNA (pseudouridine(1915)-N(3))-methyltransferase RlmH [Planobacterium oryzisoli]MBF5027365.1 23S rRNA (pseudouridine(1915)-N(3))-methyltransferase RlmH [Planobacterium oryzisoli]